MWRFLIRLLGAICVVAGVVVLSTVSLALGALLLVAGAVPWVFDRRLWPEGAFGAAYQDGTPGHHRDKELGS